MGLTGLAARVSAKFDAVEAEFASMDNLILQFGQSPEGRDLIAAYQAARVVRDLGGGTSKNKKPAATTAPESTTAPAPVPTPAA